MYKFILICFLTQIDTTTIKYTFLPLFLSDWRSHRGQQSGCLSFLFVCLSVCLLSLCGMTQAGRVGSRFHWQETNAHPFLWACSRRGLQLLKRNGKNERMQHFQKQLRSDGLLLTHTYGTDRDRVIDCQWFWFWLRGVSGWPHDQCSVSEKANKMTNEGMPFSSFSSRWGSINPSINQSAYNYLFLNGQRRLKTKALTKISYHFLLLFPDYIFQQCSSSTHCLFCSKLSTFVCGNVPLALESLTRKFKPQDISKVPGLNWMGMWLQCDFDKNKEK